MNFKVTDVEYARYAALVMDYDFGPGNFGDIASFFYSVFIDNQLASKLGELCGLVSSVHMRRLGFCVDLVAYQLHYLSVFWEVTAEFFIEKVTFMLAHSG